MRLFLSVLAVVFISETLVMFILDAIRMRDKSLEAFVDSTMLTCFATPFLWYWIVRSESERDRAEAELRRSEAHLRQLALIAERTDNAVVLTDREGRVEWVNPGFRQLTGYTLDEVRGQKPGGLLQGPETDPKMIEFMRERLNRGIEFKIEVINYSKQGRKYWVAVEVQPIRDENGEITHFMAVELDITERKEAEHQMLHLNEMLERRVQERTVELAASEERFRLMVEQVCDYAIFMLDMNGLVETWNAGAQRLNGYKAPEIVGQPFATFFNPDDLAFGKPEELMYRARFV
ncbi:MAG: PAS domain S-box protein, partial [Chthoniobacteraceae bacterium]